MKIKRISRKRWYSNRTGGFFGTLNKGVRFHNIDVKKVMYGQFGEHCILVSIKNVNLTIAKTIGTNLLLRVCALLVISQF
jgi:hypothetical protein